MIKLNVSLFCSAAMVVSGFFVSLPTQAVPYKWGVENAQPRAMVQGLDVITSHEVDNDAKQVTLTFQNGQKRAIRFYGPNIFRVFQDPQGGEMFRDPQAKPEAKILVENPVKTFNKFNVNEMSQSIEVSTRAIVMVLNKATGCMTVKDLKTGNTVIKELAAAEIEDGKVNLSLAANRGEYFFGGGVQNGRFSHRGQSINIVNENSWTDGGVCSPAPFYWSTRGYGVMFHTFRPGRYDFGAKDRGKVQLSHDEDYLDCFFMVNEKPVALLNDYYQLTGHPVLLPKFGFYEGHLNAYNRDYWKKVDEPGYMTVKFEDGNYYKEDQKDNGGIRESLNGELEGNYQFSARAVIDRYKKNDMPLGWLLPNDGYGAGYGQTATLDGNVQNLKEFGDYARRNGVEIGLWTQSDLHPIDTIAPLLQRDIVKEIRDAGVRVLKTDVAWVGAGYSFGLNGIADVATLMPQHGNDARPFIITLDGWAGTQRYGGIWTGDQTGGKWEYIRFHIPTYIGSGLAGQPNVSSDMDGIFGGKNMPVNVRDFEWKTFTPMQLNMDGWGSNEKYPQALGEPATSLNRAYLKMKSMLMPYTYTIAREAVDGKPIVRAMFLEDANRYTLSKATQYQFLYGPSILVAPIYQETKMDSVGNDVRHNIYLPKGQWVDYFTGNMYEGGAILNSFDAPLWKLPIFVKQGSIIPMTCANNNINEVNSHLRIYEIYPKWQGEVSFTEYDDDGVTQAYLQGQSSTTKISATSKDDILKVEINPTEGSFQGMEPMKATEIRLVGNFKGVKKLTALVGGKKLTLKPVKTLAQFEASKKPVYFLGTGVDYTKFFSAELKDAVMTAAEGISLKLPETDVTKNAVSVEAQIVCGGPKTVSMRLKDEPKVELAAVNGLGVEEKDRKPYSLNLSWQPSVDAKAYEIEFQGMRYFDIKGSEFLFEDLKPETKYSFRLRSVAEGKASEWQELSVQTNKDPFEFAVKGMTATCTAPSQGGENTNKLFDFDAETGWHTAYGEKAVPFDLVVDMHSVNSLDKLQYLPRRAGVNGIILEGTVSISMDKENWTEVGPIHWSRDAETKTILFEGNPQARYIKLSVTSAYGDFGSGNELYIFRVPGSAYYVPGDINNDGRLDENDLTSYMNYTGLRQGDSDFEGYVSKGDINQNGLIDAYDISNAAVEINADRHNTVPITQRVEGNITIETNKANYKAGEEVIVTIKGEGLKQVNAFSLAIPYSEKQLEYVSNEPLAAKAMENFSRDRLHTSGQKAFYPTFVGVERIQPLEGEQVLCTLRFKAKTAGPVKLEAKDIYLVDRQLYSLKK